MGKEAEFMLAILFVDDEPNILDGLRRRLRSLRSDWDLCFATQGQEALAVLATKNVDVVVSDMRMPGMNGAELLRQVSEKYPHIVRIIFSGYAEKKMMLRSTNAAHQYLTKPCDSEFLLAAVSQSCALHYLLNDKKLREVVAQMKAIPSLPDTYNKVIDELRSPDPALRRVGDIIQQDVGMTAKLLQHVNSAHFSLRRHLSDVHEAISVLGLETISTLVLGIGIFSQFPGKEEQELIESLWAHSLAVGRRAKALASRVAPVWAADAFTAGLLHDLGKVVLAVNFPAEYAEMQRLVEHGHLTATEAENQVLGICPSSLGAYLLELWGLPNSIVEAVAFFSQPSIYGAYSFRPLTAVHLANTLEKVGDDEVLAHPEQYVDVTYLQNLGVWEKLPQWIQYTLGQNALAT